MRLLLIFRCPLIVTLIIISPWYKFRNILPVVHSKLRNLHPLLPAIGNHRELQEFSLLIAPVFLDKALPERSFLGDFIENLVSLLLAYDLHALQGQVLLLDSLARSFVSLLYLPFLQISLVRKFFFFHVLRLQLLGLVLHRELMHRRHALGHKVMPIVVLHLY